jgi:hypothetical protein
MALGFGSLGFDDGEDFNEFGLRSLTSIGMPMRYVG